METLDVVKKEMGNAMKLLSKSAGEVWLDIYSNAAKENFRTMNVLQLISVNSGKALQIAIIDGKPTLDARGTVHEARNGSPSQTHWFIIQESASVVRLHINNNYLAIINGTTCVVNYPEPSTAGLETRFKVKALQGNLVTLVCDQNDLWGHLGVMESGDLIEAKSCGPSAAAQWRVKVIYSPYQDIQPDRPKTPETGPSSSGAGPSK